ncbi:MAG: hypothetical protein WBI88_03955 [Caldicoprobacterales bacterium]
MPETIVVAIISLIGTLFGSYLAQRKTTALVVYRLEQLEKKVDKHNSVIEKTYILEEQMKSVNHRLNNLEKGVR